MKRILEPEVMDTWEESVAYDAMDFTEVNTAFVEEAIAIGPESGLVLDLGTGTARIPILMAQRNPQWKIVGIDLSKNMLKLGQQHVKNAGLSDRIRLEYVDAKQLPYDENSFDFVVSNSIVHHLSDPVPSFREIARVLKPNGGLFVRDLYRPEDEATVDRLVAGIGSDYDAHQTQLFRDSLCAAFTVEEVIELLKKAGLNEVSVKMTSDRHWTAQRAGCNGR
ncbi:class I SAM-dependent methyltransferase [Baaleninema sp.]|uniref:class I SAM-dependent methyltransferase n=1 Tax=Baaleninema sp. TaxID=3101197 RepID=UPI003CFD81EB